LKAGTFFSISLPCHALAKINENTAPVVLTRGQLQITANAYVERISYSNPTFAAHMATAEKLDDARKLLVAKYGIELQALHLQRAAFDSPEWIEQQITSEPQDTPKKTRSKKTESETLLPFVERGERLQKELDRINKSLFDLGETAKAELQAVEDQVFKHLCVRASFLIGSWDLTDESESPLPTTPESLEEIFDEKRELLGQLVELVEAATFGPLGIEPASGA
jgi:hypothetical protein